MRTGYTDINDYVREQELLPARANALARARQRLAAAAQPDKSKRTLSHLRLAKGISQTRLAEMIGTSQPHLSNVEQGRSEPMLSTADKLSEALGVPLAEISHAIRNSRGK
ncbi:helix-turn-helix domain-containing protein [Sinimarinibacterium sp. CAU 1509]|uniref:helix-turn-helix domain-containing protein n=1 Tax=Sinimarinibacterium sp. CAU 1509 TaxID=2562283 RepID=UPI00346056D3